MIIRFFLVAGFFYAQAWGAVNSDLKYFVQSRILQLALEQSEKITPAWDPLQRDCAGFVRFIFRSALQGGSQMWFDKSHKKVSYVSAQELVHYNFELQSRNLEQTALETGDLLIFYDPEKKIHENWHIMLILSPTRFSVQKDLVIYHNGSSGKDAKIRKIWLDDLKQFQDFRFRPLSENNKFLGVFHWKAWRNT